MLFRQMASALAGALVLAGVMATNALAQRDLDDDWRRGHRAEWELLGQKRVGFSIDRDIIQVGQSEDWYRTRRFRSLHFQALRNDVHMLSDPPRLSQWRRRGLPHRPPDPAGRGAAARSEGREELHWSDRDDLPLASGLRRGSHHQGVRRAVSPRSARTASGPDAWPHARSSRLGRARLPAGLTLRQGPRHDPRRPPRGTLQGDPAARPRCGRRVAKRDGSSIPTGSRTIFQRAISSGRADTPRPWI